MLSQEAGRFDEGAMVGGLTLECLFGESLPRTSCLGTRLCPPPLIGPLDDDMGTCQRGSGQKKNTHTHRHICGIKTNYTETPRPAKED